MQSNGNAHQRLRSQYPSDSAEGHVEFILVATFDIDRGSVMEHQYPEPISGDETMLAELMLPDQVHSRAQDWTLFFLHKETGNDEDRKRLKSNGETTDQEDDEEARREAIIEEEEEDDLLQSAPLIYVLNHVNTKHDASVTRGAIVKAMAICTRHSFVDIFKVILASFLPFS